MKKNLNTLIKLFTVLCFIITHSGYSQPTIINKNTGQQKNVKNGYIRCATTENEKLLQAKNPKRLSKTEFEDWLAPIVEAQKKN